MRTAGGFARHALPCREWSRRRDHRSASLSNVGIENPVHLLLIAVVALIVLGPRRLPDLAKALGHGIREFRDAMSSGERDEPEQPPVAAAPAPPSATAHTQAAPTAGAEPDTVQASEQSAG
jgi:sec-independent protein translocase protein TatA